MIKLNVIVNNSEIKDLAKIFKQRVNEELQKKKIEEFFHLNKSNIFNIYLDTKEGLDKYILNNTEAYRSGVPTWVTGFTTNEEAHLACASDCDIEELIKTGIHEIIHLISFKLTVKGDRIVLLEEGLAYYLASQMTAGRFEYLKEDFESSKIKRLKDLSNYSNDEFAKNKGYFYGFFLIKYIKTKYSSDKVLYYITSPEKFIEDIDTIELGFIKFMKSEFEKYK